MSKMALAWLLAYCGLLLAGFAQPIFGLLGYLLEYYLRPSLNWWGKDLPSFSWTQLAAGAMAAAFFVRMNEQRHTVHVRNPQLKWLLGLGLVMLLVTPFAVDMAFSWYRTVFFWKYIVLYALIVGIVRTERDFDLFILMHMLGSAWWGWEAFVSPSRAEGRLLFVGSGDTLNDNMAVAHLLTVVPFIPVYLLKVRDKWLRIAALVAAPLVVNLIILCNSRGGMVGLVVAFLASFLLVKGVDRMRLLGVGLAAALAFAVLADPEFITRQQTTASPEDGSARGRIESWKGGIRLIRDHPFGAGGYGYNALSPRYIPIIVESHEGALRSPHNTLILIGSEWGIQGLVLFAALMGSTFLLLHRIRWLVPAARDGLYYKSLAIEIGLIGTMVASLFSDRFYGESNYWMMALSFALYRTRRTELAESAADQTAAGAGTEERADRHVPEQGVLGERFAH